MQRKKGVSLIVLVITIIVMIILAGAVILSLSNAGIIGKANEAVDKTNLAQAQAIATTIWSDEYLSGKRGDELKDAVREKFYSQQGITEDKYTIEVTTTGVKVALKPPKVSVNEVAKENSTIDGQMYSATNPVIPKGFMAINTTTSTWGNTSTYKNGLVISDGTSEFVWIPVPTLSDMAVETSGKDANGRTNYRGVLYDWTSTGYPAYVADGQFKEPENIIISDYPEGSDNQDNYSTITWTETYFQESFNKMVESVAKYEGFYVGRYETSLNGTVAQSKAGERSMSANTWWELYEKSKTYSSTNTSLEVESEMMWGCQWDAMLMWMNSNNIDVTSVEPTDPARGVKASYNETKITGATDSNDILNNVHDLLGNSLEWTQEADITNYYRNHRGGDYTSAESASIRWGDFPDCLGLTYDGSRLSLYVEV